MTKLDDEIRAALAANAPTDEERAAWAHAALEDAPPRRRRLHPIWPLLTAAAIAGVFLLPRNDAPTHAQEDDGDRIVAVNGDFLQSAADTPVARERAKNVRHLKRQSILKDAKAGFWAIVVDGDSMRITPNLEDALRWADKLSPDARQRFVFKVVDGKVPGDAIFDRSRAEVRLGGLTFLEAAGLKFEKKDARWTLTHGEKTIELKEPPFELEIDDKAVTITLDRESLAPLILPRGMENPRFEIPGRTILEHLDRRWFAYRRYLVHVRHKGLGLDRWIEAIGEPKWFGVRLGGYVFQGLSGETLAERARKAKRPLLVLRMKDGSQEYLNALFDKIEIGNYEQIVIPNATETVIERHLAAKDQRIRGVGVALALPDASKKTLEGLRRVVR
jgi:hypothetical protein